MLIGVYNHLLRKVFRFHYHSQKVIGSLGYIIIYITYIPQMVLSLGASFHTPFLGLRPFIFGLWKVKQSWKTLSPNRVGKMPPNPSFHQYLYTYIDPFSVPSCGGVVSQKFLGDKICNLGKVEVHTLHDCCYTILRLNIELSELSIKLKFYIWYWYCITTFALPETNIAPNRPGPKKKF